MSSARAARKARQVARIQPKKVWIERKLYDVDKIPQDLIDRGYIFETKEEELPNGGD